jgi:CheY-like chemotaxis protein
MAYMMIIDDDLDAQQSLALCLKNAGHRVVCARNGRDALSLILQQIPDAILLDLMMPELDGPSLLEVIRSHLRIQSLPVVVLTGLAESPMIERVRALSVNAILIKGKADTNAILKALEEAIARVPN